MKETRRRPESDGAVGVTGKRPRTPPLISDDEAEFPIEEETVMEVMKLLEEELMRTCSENKPSSSSSSSSSSLCFSSPSPSSTFSPLCSSSFVTINGNEESCGPSFSDSASTVMASVDVSGISISCLMERTGELVCGSTSFKGEETTAEEEKIECCSWPEVDLDYVSEINGCDGGESGDEWMERVLSVGPFEFEM